MSFHVFIYFALQYLFRLQKAAARLYFCPPLLSLEMTRRFCRRVISQDGPAIFIYYANINNAKQDKTCLSIKNQSQTILLFFVLCIPPSKGGSQTIFLPLSVLRK